MDKLARYNQANQEGYLVYKINFFKDNQLDGTYIGSCRGYEAKDRWSCGLMLNNSKSRHYNHYVQQAKDDCDSWDIDVVAYGLDREDARILEYTLINHNPLALNIIRKPDCRFELRR